MKKLFTLIAFIIFTFGMIRAEAVKIILNGDLQKYQYAYVIPTSGVTSSSGGEGFVLGTQYGVIGGSDPVVTRTINPSEMIAGHLMKMGYTIVPQIPQELEANTLIVSYGYLEGKGRSEFRYASATILIQFRDAKTQQLVASFETTGNGNNDSESIADAISSAMELCQYSIDPMIEIEFGDVYKKRFYLNITNKTPRVVNTINLHITYYLDGKVVHEQDVTVESRILIKGQLQTMIMRDEEAQSRKMQIRAKVVSYN